MALTQISSPLPIFTSLDGAPLDYGYIYIGLANYDAEASPAEVFWDKDGLIPAPQPLRTTGGYIYRSGSPASVYCNDSYSITIRDKVKRLVFAAKNLYDYKSSLSSSSGTDLIGYSRSEEHTSELQSH